MEYCVVTYGDKLYKMNEAQCEKFANAYANPKNTSIPLPSGNLLARGDVRYIGALNEAPQPKVRHYVPAEQIKLATVEGATDKIMIDSAVLALSGELAHDAPKSIKLRMKRIWFEHVKRRPVIDKIKLEERVSRRKEWQKKANLDSNDPRNYEPKNLRNPQYSHEEVRIINTPIEKLMAEYEASL